MPGRERRWNVGISVPPGGFARRDGGVFGGDAMRLNGDDDRPVRPLFDVGNHDLSVPQGNGRRTHDSARSVGADFLDDQVARGTRDRQEGRAGMLTQALRREGTHPTGSSVGILISPSLVPYRRSQGLHERHRSTTDRSPRRKHLARAGARGCKRAAHAERAQQIDEVKGLAHAETSEGWICGVRGGLSCEGRGPLHLRCPARCR